MESCTMYRETEDTIWKLELAHYRHSYVSFRVRGVLFTPHLGDRLELGVEVQSLKRRNDVRSLELSLTT
jgi:hypothetical protein